ncbi:NXPE family member 1-like [Pseudophryne corroboree]|uniref:NXPE family member 1-like n=1 Tax=Pseudophryne corroboree TaxID=495146 RepID=UPI00308213D6
MKDFGLLSSRSSAMVISARKALWICQWNADAKSKKNIEALPYNGEALFGDKLDAMISTTTSGKFKFKMESLRAVISSLEEKKFLVSGDIKDAYLHVPIYPPHQAYLRTIRRMFKSENKGFKKLLALTIIFSVLFGFITHLKMFQGQVEIMTMGTEPEKKGQQINQLLTFMNQTIPNVEFMYLNETTSAKESTATIIDYKEKYCVGDIITVRIEMFSYLGKKKTYGGDYLSARIFSSKLAAGASGKVEDFYNGTYNVYFTLFWEGPVQISILLMHPSEGVSALWKARNSGYKLISYIGKFLNKSQEVQTQCGFHMDSQAEICAYEDKKYEEFFYCIKPPGVACEAFISLRSMNTPYTNLTNMEKNLFNRSKIGEQMMKQTQNIDVLKCTGTSTSVKPKCQTGMPVPFPSGYFLKNHWYPLFCNLSTDEPLSHIHTCLARKMIYLMGDSTVRQWIEYFPKLLKTLKFFYTPGSGWHKLYIALDVTNDIFIQWKKHGQPFVTNIFFNVKEDASVTTQINRLGGGSNTIIVIALGQHFRSFPIDMFIRRLINVRKAIENLFLRSPDTKVIIKSENTREMDHDVERFSDFHGYIQYLLMKDIFKGLNVGVIDAWDMTTAIGSHSTHPSETVIRNQINMFLSYIC